MFLRKLELKDAAYMFEWMHDDSVVEKLQTDFASKTMEDCEKFISNSFHDEKNIHLAIVNESDEYMGTVSLKNIDMNTKSAEFAITIRSSAMGKGYSKYAMDEMIRVAFEKIGLLKVYWCVDPDNKRAVRFYDKNKYQKVSIDNIKKMGINAGYSIEQIERYIWYWVV